jgi:predicted homoserine dehydrogenase-like protein
MIIVDHALEKRLREGNPIRVALLGAGFMGRGIAHQVFISFPAIRLVGISNRHISAAKKAYMDGGVSDVRVAGSLVEVERGIREGGGL